MTAESKEGAVREAVGVFFEAGSMEEAIKDLRDNGFGHEEINLLASQYAVRQSLGHLYEEINADAGDPEGPRTAFVAKESVGDTVHAILGAVSFTGATVAAGAVVATAGALGTALMAAAAGAAAVGGIGALLAAIIGQSEAEHLEEEVDRGHLLLVVRTDDPERESRALEILSKHSSFEPHIIDVANHGAAAD